MREVLIVVVVMALIACCLQGCLFGKKSEDQGGAGKDSAKLPEDPTKIAGAPGAPPGMPGVPTPAGAPGAAPGGAPPGMPGAPGAAPPAGPPPGMPGAGAPPAMPGAAPGAAPAAAPAGGDASATAKEGLKLKAAGDYAGAAAKFATAIAADPNNADAIWGGAWVAAEMGQKDMAKQLFEKYLAVGKDSGKISKAKAAMGRLSK
jgi:hypothetical protein